MAVYIENITETLIIPDGSQERFISFPSYPESEGWFNSGVELAGMSYLKPGYLVRRPHCWHHVLIFCSAGELHYECETIKGKIVSGEKFFIPAGYLHKYHTGKETRMHWFHLSPRHSRWSYLEGLAPCAGKALYGEDCGNLMEKIYAEGQGLPHRSANIPQAYCQLALALLDGELESGIADAEIVLQAKIGKLLRAVGGDLRKQWSVPQLARLSGMSVSHFHAVFESLYGKSPMAAVQEMRMEQAKSMLQAGATLESIAEMLGYGSPFSLSRAFKACTGMSPRDYRHKIKL